MGAGAVTSNVKSDKSQVDVKYAGGRIETGRRKLGAMIGDFAEIGCNSVLCPGSVIGKNTTVYPASCVRGCIPADSIYKNGGVTVEKKNM
jgi:acetyltransferase-like isoleucine patch superfamily enzyme